jgi:SAM-dependent methyltransferase
METDQELFAKGLATYQKVVRHNYMAHREVYDLLHDVLVSEAPKQFVFLDIACGTATGPAQALRGTNVGGYVGVDISGPSLEVARQELNSLPCPTDLRRQNFVEAIKAWDEPVHVMWIGQSLHHLKRSEKQEFLRRARDSLTRRAFPHLGADLFGRRGSRRLDAAISTDTSGMADGDRRRVRRL